MSIIFDISRPEIRVDRVRILAWGEVASNSPCIISDIPSYSFTISARTILIAPIIYSKELLRRLGSKTGDVDESRKIYCDCLGIEKKLDHHARYVLHSGSLNSLCLSWSSPFHY